ncbi:Methyltransferase-like protein 7B [Nowakowskiella sp. JEL0407]|nr:Methyltransferase-like protein 7B [Nowakowskiella sp. JEL0407]
MGGFLGYYYSKLAQISLPAENIHLPLVQSTIANNKKTQQVYSSLAKKYDEQIDWDEWYMGMASIRKDLLSICEGSVLEVSTGTGRNIPYYPISKIKSLTLTDSNPQMLTESVSKATAQFTSPKPSLVSYFFSSQNKSAPPVRYLVSDAQTLYSSISLNGENDADAGILQKDGGYDVVVDTFGLCSCEDPTLALKNMVKCCKPSGRILLLEHGRVAEYGDDQGGYVLSQMRKLIPSSFIELCNEILDKSAKDHAEKWGCWWNRDILSIVEQAGMEVEKVERFHFGTTYLIVGKPKNGQLVNKTGNS